MNLLNTETNKLAKQRSAAYCSVFLKVKEACFVDVLYVLVEGNGLLKDDNKISDVRGGGYCGTVNGEGEVVGGFGEHFGSNDNNF